MLRRPEPDLTGPVARNQSFRAMQVIVIQRLVEHSSQEGGPWELQRQPSSAVPAVPNLSDGLESVDSSPQHLFGADVLPRAHSAFSVLPLPRNTAEATSVPQTARDGSALSARALHSTEGRPSAKLQLLKQRQQVCILMPLGILQRGTHHDAYRIGQWLPWVVNLRGVWLPRTLSAFDQAMLIVAGFEASSECTCEQAAGSGGRATKGSILSAS